MLRQKPDRRGAPEGDQVRVCWVVMRTRQQEVDETGADWPSKCPVTTTRTGNEKPETNSLLAKTKIQLLLILSSEQLLVLALQRNQPITDVRCCLTEQSHRVADAMKQCKIQTHYFCKSSVSI